jgi:hypothetical protein
MIEGKPLTDSLLIDTARLQRLSVIPLKAFCLHGKEKVLSQTAQRGYCRVGTPSRTSKLRGLSYTSISEKH